MDFYIAALGRSGSTALANWLTTPPTHVVFHEPNLVRHTPTRLMAMQLSDWGLTREEALAGHWAVKETSCALHSRMVEAYQPRKVVLCVRNIRDAALSLFEKHRRQGTLATHSDQWAVNYLLTEAAGLVEFAQLLERRQLQWTIFRYEDLSDVSLRAVADWVEWPGGGDMARGFEDFGRGFEVDRARARGLTDQLHLLAAETDGRCAAFTELFYPRRQRS